MAELTNPVIHVTENVTLDTLQDVPADISFVSSIFDKIASYGVNVDMISVTPPQGTRTSLSFTLSDDELEKVLKLSATMQHEPEQLRPIVSSGNYKISIRDPHMENQPGVAARVFEAASKGGADIRIITTSEIQISLLVTAATFDSAYASILQAAKGVQHS